VLHPVLRRHDPGNLRARGRRETFGAVEGRQFTVTIACAIKLSNSSVSTRSVFQIIERSVTRTSGASRPDAWPCARRLPCSVSGRCDRRRRCLACRTLHFIAQLRSGRLCRHSHCGIYRSARGAIHRRPCGQRRTAIGVGFQASGGAPQANGAAEDDQVDQRIGAEPIGAVHAETQAASPTAIRPGTTLSGSPLAEFGQHFAVIVRGNPAHIVMDGRQDRDRLARYIDAGENACALSEMPGRRSCMQLSDRGDPGAD
jgi:hypothetical protein